MVLETSAERVKLLKGGIDGKTIEKVYIAYNNFRIVKGSILYHYINQNYDSISEI